MDHPEKDKKRKVRRLVDVDVTHVSLVDKPANRTPFKFVKRDGSESEKGEFPMNITLKNMFGSRAPEVTSVIADTREKAVAVAKMLIDGDNAEITEQDGVFVVRKANAGESPEERLIHLGKRTGIAYTVANLRKELRLFDMDGEGFDDAVKQEGFVPGLMVGMDALHQTIANIANAEDTNSPDVFRDKVSKAIEDFGNYVSSLIDALPEKAFKFEKALAAVAPAGSGKLHFTPEGFNAEVYDAVFGGEAPNPSADMKEADAAPTESAPVEATDKPADAAPAAEASAPAEGAEGADKPAQEADAAASAEGNEVPKPDNLEELPEAPSKEAAPSMEEVVREALAELTKDVGKQIADAVKPLAERADATDAALDKLTKAVGGSVATTPEEDADNVVRLSKGTEPGGGYGGGEPPLMDTAYNVNRG